MNKQLMLVITLLGLSVTSVFADMNQKKLNRDKAMMKQCQYIVSGTGVEDLYIAGLLYGIIDGMGSMIAPEFGTEFAINATNGEKVHEICQSALSNMSNNGFRYDFMMGVARLMIKQSD